MSDVTDPRSPARGDEARDAASPSGAGANEVPSGPVAPDRLRTRCRLEDLAFATTADVAEPPPGALQHRALTALELGVQIGSATHNVYVMGRPGSGRHAIVRQALERAAATRAPPPDWCYVNRFDDPQRPRAIRLPHGRGATLKADMQELVGDIRAALPAALESEAHRNRHAELERALEERVRKSLEAVREEAEKAGVALIRTPDGFGIAPVRGGEILAPEQFAKLPEREQARLRARIDAIGEMLRKHVESVPLWNRDHHRRLREIDREVTQRTVRAHIEDLRARYADCAEVLDHLAGVEADLVENAGAALRTEMPSALAALGLSGAVEHAQHARYEVNVLVDSRSLTGAPVVYEGSPTYQNLIGQIENVAQFGTLVTDFTLVRAGALHRANGGFLILDAERLLSQAFSWDALKHALFERAVRIESLGQRLSLISTLSLEPDRIPLDLRVVLIGTRLAYDLLSALDPEFAELFKIAADFDDAIERGAGTTQLYAQMIGASARREGLVPFAAEAVARLVEHGSRLAGDSRKLTTHWRSLEDCLREASHYARAQDRTVAAAADVDRAIEAEWQRLARQHEETIDAIRSRVRLIDFDGEAVGQVNGLSLTPVGALWFGQPSRITATVRIGEGEVLDIEREVKLGGAVHSKGVLILTSLIGARFGARAPLSLQASLAFEQSYGGVEGDSASLAEGCALLSAIAEAPVRQSLAVTGSLNQHGRVQAVGGINEKIEGFFDACRVRGLTGRQGVIMPADNVTHLMLRDEVVAAVGRGEFQIFAVHTLDEAMALLTGLPAGERDAAGAYPAGSLNASIERRLGAFVERRRALERGAEPSQAEPPS